MKKLIGILLAAMLVVGAMAGCGGTKGGTVSTDGSTSMEKVIGALSESFMAQNSGGAMSPLHPVTGFLAIALMLFHAAWATYVVFRGNEKTRRGFHTLSIVVWLVWLVPYFVGMLIGIPAFHVSDPVALAAAAGVVAVLALALLLTSKRSHA